jgi:hypothetical protein
LTRKHTPRTRGGQPAPDRGPTPTTPALPPVLRTAKDRRIGTDRVDHDVELFGRFKRRAPNVDYLVDAERT